MKSNLNSSHLCEILENNWDDREQSDVDVDRPNINVLDNFTLSLPMM